MARILFMSDNPNICTGMGKVHRELAMGMMKRGHHVESLGWFSSLDYPNKMPWKVYATRNQYYGSDVLDSVVQQSRPEILITIGDCWMISHVADKEKCRSRRTFKWVNYCPIDGAAFGDVLPPTWIPTFRDMDVKVAYTEYAKKIILKTMPELKDEIRVIPHGVDTKIFHPLPKEQTDKRRRHLGIDKINPDGEVTRSIMYLVVARNQPRKNIPEIAKAWAEFTKDGAHPNALLWPHMMFQDSMGCNLDEVFDITGIRKNMGYFERIAHASSNLRLMTEPDLNLLYNMCDVFLLMSGEGFGLPTIEAMACGKPVILMDHSANMELGRGRGELVKVRSYLTGNHLTERPYPDQECLVRAMDRMYTKTERRLEYGRKALKFITEGDPNQYHGKALTWDNACDQWHELMKELEHPLAKPIKLREVS